MQRAKKYDEPSGKAAGLNYGCWGCSYPDSIEAEFLGLSLEDKQHLAILDVPGGQFGGSMDELNDAGTYFDLGVRECKQPGSYHYMSTRNNNFSNRSQKGLIVVTTTPLTSKTISSTGGTIVQATGTGAGSSVTFAAETVSQTTKVTLSFIPPEDVPFCDGKCGGHVMLLTADDAAISPGKTFSVSVAYSPSGSAFAALWFSPTQAGTFNKVENYKCANSVCTAEVSQAGYFAVKLRTAAEVIVPLVLLAIIAIVGVGICFWRGMFCFAKIRGPIKGKGGNPI